MDEEGNIIGKGRQQVVDKVLRDENGNIVAEAREEQADFGSLMSNSNKPRVPTVRKYDTDRGRKAMEITGFSIIDTPLNFFCMGKNS